MEYIHHNDQNIPEDLSPKFQELNRLERKKAQLEKNLECTERYRTRYENELEATIKEIERLQS